MNKKGFTLVELVVDCSAVHDESKKLEKQSMTHLASMATMQAMPFG